MIVTGYNIKCDSCRSILRLNSEDRINVEQAGYDAGWVRYEKSDYCTACAVELRLVVPPNSDESFNVHISTMEEATGEIHMRIKGAPSFIGDIETHGKFKWTHNVLVVADRSQIEHFRDRLSKFLDDK